MILAINGYEYKTLPVIKFKYSVEILDGPGTGRMDADGWPMFREPQGIIKNVELEIGLDDTSNQSDDFKRLLATLDSFGAVDFMPVSFATPAGTITQNMYGTSYSVELQRATRDGATYWGTIPIRFIAQKGTKG